MYNMKQLEVSQYEIGDYTFYVRKFPAFAAARNSALLAKVVGPLLGAIAPLFGALNDNVTLADVDVTTAGNAIGAAFSDLSEDEFDKLLKTLLIDSGNVSVCGPMTEGETKVLDMKLADDVFCGDVQDMFILCFHVIRLNYGNFFSKIGGQFGDLVTRLEAAKMTTESPNMESLT